MKGKRTTTTTKGSRNERNGSNSEKTAANGTKRKALRDESEGKEPLPVQSRDTIIEKDDDINVPALDSDSEDDFVITEPLTDGDISDYEDDEQPNESKREKLPEIDPIYETDESDDEENTVGAIPLEWYEDHEHMGYDKDGQKIMKPTKDELDSLLARLDDPNVAQSVYDKFKMANIKLGKEELDIIKNVVQNSYPVEPTDEPTVEWFTSQVSQTPLSAAPEPKRRFIPSRWEAKKIMKIVQAIRKGIFDPNRKIEKKTGPYKMWDDEEEGKELPSSHIPAPKAPLPDHAHSYNPPAEYVMTQEEIERWENTDPEDRDYNFLIKKYENLRSVPGYNRFIQERFERCLDLYLCPRVKGKQLHTDPDKLLPKLPDPRDLLPFPQALAVVYKGHTTKVRVISVDPSGQWLASGSECGELRFWEVSTGCCLNVFKLGSAVMALAWNPNKDYAVVVVSCGSVIYLINPKISPKSTQTHNETLIAAAEPSKPNQHSTWSTPSLEEKKQGYLIRIEQQKTVTSLSWHRRGDYFVSVAPEATSGGAVQIHHLSKRQSLSPFKKFKSQVQHVLFHPASPILFVATRQHVLVYNLTKQEKIKTLMSGVKWISSMDIHPLGDNLIVGSYDQRLCWFDLDLSNMPYKTLRYHNHAVRRVAYHKKYPLFVSCGDDGRLNVFHGKVYPDDLMRQPLIVPVKVIQAHNVIGDHGALDCVFHPTQPWVFSGGADNEIKLFS